MRIRELPTPALLLDADLFTSNIERMASLVSAAGKSLRPHAKAHKCVEIAKRQLQAGAIGVCAATVAEAELMVHAGIRGVLLTSPLADISKMKRMAALAAIADDTAVVVDHPEQVRLYRDAALNAGVTLNVVIDLDVGDHRTGIAPGLPVLRLARDILDGNGLSFQGLQAYSVRASHLPGVEERRQFSVNAMRCAVETRDLLMSEGVPVKILSGGSTGTYGIDMLVAEMTELQAGSYAFMDGAYQRIGGVQFGQALSVLATVISANHPDRVTVDAGFKAFSTDRPFGPDLLEIAGARYEWAGDEFGYVYLDQPSQRIRLGDRLRFVPPHCDPTVNLYDRYYVCRGNNVEDVWPIMDRWTPSRTPRGLTSA
jgi:D-serine deaminase-like pyridoxal phosphate-dependent protein